MNALIWGLGNIAWKYESTFTESGEQIIRNHFDALKAKGFKYIIGVDPDEESRLSFSKATGQESFATFQEALDKFKIIELVSITSPSQFHYEQCVQCLKHNIPFIWLEKPAAMNLNEIEKLMTLKQKSNSQIVVNYLRRFSAPYKFLKQLVDEKKFGELTSITANYSRDILNNGVHLIDLLSYYTHNREVEILHTFAGKNPTIVAKCDAINLMLVGNDVDYHNIDISLTFKHGRASVVHGGKQLVVEKQVENNEFPIFTRLEEVKRESYDYTGYDFPQALEALLEIKKNKKTDSDLEESIYIAKFLQKAGIIK